MTLRRLSSLLRLPSWGALAGVVICYCLSFTPSLIPRVWWLQAAAGANTAAFGYGIGAFLQWLLRRCGAEVPAEVRRWARIAPPLGWTDADSARLDARLRSGP